MTNDQYRFANTYRKAYSMGWTIEQLARELGKKVENVRSMIYYYRTKYDMRFPHLQKSASVKPLTKDEVHAMQSLISKGAKK